MDIIHQTRDLKYRSPFGAVPTDERVVLAINIQSSTQIRDCYLSYSYGLQCFSESKNRMMLKEPANSKTRYECTIRAPDEACLLFYWFEIITDNGIVYYVRNQVSKDGTGVVSTAKPVVISQSQGDARPFQITVFNREFKTPDWFKGCVLYQIFPDRFSRDAKFSFDKMKNIKNAPERIYHEKWNEDVDYNGTKEFGYLACDFFGGSLEGIREKLGYLSDLGIDAIYLNPVFESRSNHRYDTGNYEKIDPILGTNEDFEKLIEDGKNSSINIILDGVFSHTGADSIYFNKYGRYENTGAFQDAEGKVKSPYFSWYHFNLQHGYISYDSWWGFSDLPCVNENDLMFKEYILGDSGVVRKWLKMGTSGWRLDVSDEIPDSFLRELRKSVKRENDSAVIIGEVWEDASNKISFGSYRDFLFGNTHDSIMGYTFKDAVIGWLSGKINVIEMNNLLETVRENYPSQAFYSIMNLISSHDVPRAITELSGDQWVTTREEQSKKDLSHDQRKFGEKLLKLAMMIQFTYPGTPSIYYGDEIAMEGYRDPFNRRTFNWETIENNFSELHMWITSLIHFRKQNKNFKSGYYETIKSDEDIYAFRRYFVDGKDIFGNFQEYEPDSYVFINRNPYDVKISAEGYSGALSPYSGVIIISGQRVFETEWKPI